MAYPTYVTHNGSGTSDTTASFSVNLPGSLVTGNVVILIVGIRSDLTQVCATPTNWNSIANNGDDTTNMGVFWRKVDDTWKNDTTVSVPITNYSDPTYAAACTYQFSGVSTSPAPEGDLARHVTGTANADPPNYNPAGGTKDFVYIAAYFTRDNGDTTSWSLPDNQISYVDVAPPTSGNARCSACTDELRTDSYNPGTFTNNDSPWSAATIALHPTSGGDATGRGILRGVGRGVG